MSNNPYAKELQITRTALHEAARLCRSVQDLEVIKKQDRSPVTIADFGSQSLVCRALREAFPHDPIIAEEDSKLLRAPDQSSLRELLEQHLQAIRPGTSIQSAMTWIDYGNAGTYTDRFWTLDPIDGTKGFLRKGHFAVALALIVKGIPVVAGLACPKLDDEIFLATRGYGATQGGHPLHVSAMSSISHARICQSVESGHSALGDAQKVAEQLGITSEPVSLDSQAKYAVVAQGEAEIYMRLPTCKDYVERIWDHAAGALLLTEAGGTVTDCAGKALDFSHGKGLDQNRGIIATNGKVHEHVLKALKSLKIGQE